MKVCLDIGHGKFDPGACNGDVQEKTITLLIGFQLQHLLLGAGHEVLMTRTGDEYVSLQARVEKSNKWIAERFISIHCNSFSDKAVTGFETWYYTQALWAQKTQVALKEAEVGHKDRGIKRCSGYAGNNPSPDGGPQYVLIYTNSPAILVECEFISNDGMRDWLLEESSRKAIAQAIFKSI